MKKIAFLIVALALIIGVVAAQETTDQAATTPVPTGETQAKWNGWTILGVLLLGAFGGFIVNLLQDKGLYIGALMKKDDKTFLYFGFPADMLIGATAALVVYGINPPSEILTIIVIGITSGIGGTAILMAYVKGKAADTKGVRLRSIKLFVDQEISRGAANIDTQVMKNFIDSLEETGEKSSTP